MLGVSVFIGEQPIDELGTFARIRVLLESVELFDGGQEPDDVEINPSSEGSVIDGCWETPPSLL